MVRNFNDCLFCELHQFTLINLVKRKSLLLCTLVHIAGCPTPNALLCIVGWPTVNSPLCIARCPTLKALLYISVPYFEPGSV